MAGLEFFVVSRAVSIDQVTNQISVFEIVEEVHASSFPGYMACVAVSLWRREEGDKGQDFQLLLRITSPGGSNHELRTNFRFTAARHRVTQRIEGLPIEQEGMLRFEAILNDQHAAEHIVDVYLTAPVDTTGAPADPT